MAAALPSASYQQNLEVVYIKFQRLRFTLVITFSVRAWRWSRSRRGEKDSECEQLRPVRTNQRAALSHPGTSAPHSAGDHQ